MPPKGCTNVAVKKIISCLNEASANLPGWKELAFDSVDEIKPYFGDEEEEEEQQDGNKSHVEVTIVNGGEEQEENEQEER